MTERLLGDSIKKVFLTGGAGFIGSHVTDTLLAQNYEVTVYDNLSSGRMEYLAAHRNVQAFRFVEGDINESAKIREAMKGHDLVWHLAANTDIPGGFENPERDLKDCVAGTFQTLEAMRANKIRPILFSSTGAVYGDLCDNAFASEEAGPLLPVSLYAAGKIGSEAFISAFAALYGIRAWIFRFGNVIGGRMTHGVIFDFIRKLKQNPVELLVLGDGRQEKNYFLVEDCIEGMGYAFRHAVLDEKHPTALLNLGTDSVTNVLAIAKMVTEEMQLPDAKIRVQGEARAWPGDQPRVHIAVERMKALGWKAPRHSDEAVRLAVRRMLTAGEKHS